MEYLHETPSLDVKSSLIFETVGKLMEGHQNEVDRAIHIHDFVRDQVQFGWAPEFDEQLASKTLAAKVGFCNTKTPLFVTMMRAAKIPARIHFVGIDKKILSGLLNPLARYVDHCFAEVYLEGRWLQVDSYIVDRPLYRKAVAKLQSQRKAIGYGVHGNGSCTWDGRTDSFSQFVNDGTSPRFSDTDFGVHEDVPSFYRSGQARTPRNWLFRRAILRPILAAGNKNVKAMRG